MISQPGRRRAVVGEPRAARRPEPGLTWWLSGAVSLLWRLPLLVILSGLTAWFAFRALVHMAFLFDRQPLVTFLLAPVLLPFAAGPPFCFYALIRYLPRRWRGLSPRQRVLAIVGGPWVALVLAIMIDLVHINLLRLAGIPLPRLPFDPY